MSADDGVTRREITHVLIGGGICLFATLSLFGIIDIALEQILMHFGILGVIIFDSFVTARTAIAFALVYLVSGFIGGLYTGYFTEKGLNITLPITGAIGFIGFLLLLFFSGGSFSLSKVYFERIVLPLLGSITGAYLGGYTIRRPSEETEEEGEITLELEE